MQANAAEFVCAAQSVYLDVNSRGCVGACDGVGGIGAEGLVQHWFGDKGDSLGWFVVGMEVAVGGGVAMDEGAKGHEYFAW